MELVQGGGTYHYTEMKRGKQVMEVTDSFIISALFSFVCNIQSTSYFLGNVQYVLSI